MGPAGLWGRSRANPKSMIFTGAPGVSSAYRMFYRREAGDSQGQHRYQAVLLRGLGPAPTSGFRSRCTTPASSCMKLTADTKLRRIWLASDSLKSRFLRMCSSSSPPRSNSRTR